MKVVLDSNIIISDFWMHSAGFKILFEKSKNGEIDLYLPQVVFDEVVNKFNQRMDKHESDINNEVSRLKKLSGSNFAVSISATELKKAKAKYKAHLEIISKNNGITIIPHPDTKHDYLAKKAMLKKKPFNANEKGYRDSLIWENIKSLLSGLGEDIPAAPELVFVCNNHTDFAGEGHSLHAELKQELEDEDLHPDAVDIYSSLAEFNEKVTKLLFAQASLFEAKLIKGEFEEFDLKAEIDGYLFKKFVGTNLNNYYSFARYANDNPMVDTINDDYTIATVKARKLNSKEYIVDVSFGLEAEIDYFIDKSEYWSNDDLNVHVIDMHWNDHVVAVSDTVTLKLEMTLVINSKFECTSIDINKINDEFTGSPPDEYG